jgi:hypothetical protein
LSRSRGKVFASEQVWAHRRPRRAGFRASTRRLSPGRAVQTTHDITQTPTIAPALQTSAQTALSAITVNAPNKAPAGRPAEHIEGCARVGSWVP